MRASAEKHFCLWEGSAAGQSLLTLDGSAAGIGGWRMAGLDGNSQPGNFVPVGSPYYDEKVRLERRIKAINEELTSLQEAISKIQRSL